MIGDNWIRIARNGRLSQGYIVEGARDEYKEAFLLNFIIEVILRFDGSRKKEVLHRMLKDGNYADLYLIEADGGLSIKKNQIDRLQGQLAKVSTENSYKFAIIKNAHLMTVEAQNSFLKTLEEPPGKCIIFLVTNKSIELLETIKSRCSYLWLGEKDVDIYEDDRDALEKLRNGKYFYKTKEFLMEKCGSKEESLLFFERLEKILHEDMLKGVPLEDLTMEFSAISEAREAISRQMNINNALGIMTLKFGGFHDKSSRGKI